MIPAGKRDTVLSALDEEGIDYAIADETSGREYTAVVWFPLPTKAVEPVLEMLRQKGIEREAYTVVVSAETVLSTQFEELEERYAEDKSSEDRIAREELITHAKDLAPSWRTFLVLTVVSAIVATVGVLLDSPAVVVGSMVIAPLIGPAMATSVGTVIDERDLFVRGAKLQVVGFFVAIAAAAVFAWIIKVTRMIPPGVDVFANQQIESRLAPDFLSLAVALGAGIAGALSLSTGVSAALVGVMIAVALIPPTAVIGIGIAWGNPQAILGSSVLVLINALSINLSALAVLWYMGYRPEHWFRVEDARTSMLKRGSILLVGVVILSLFLGGVTYGTFQEATFKNDAAAEVEIVLSEEPYDHLELLSFNVRYGGSVPLRDAERVTISIGRPEGSRYPNLAPIIRNRIAYATGTDVAVEIHYVDIAVASS